MAESDIVARIRAELAKPGDVEVDRSKLLEIFEHMRELERVKRDLSLTLLRIMAQCSNGLRVSSSDLAKDERLAGDQKEAEDLIELLSKD